MDTVTQRELYVTLYALVCTLFPSQAKEYILKHGENMLSAREAVVHKSGQGSDWIELPIF